MMGIGSPCSWPWTVVRSRVLWFGCFTVPPIDRKLLPELAAIAATYGLRVRIAATSVEVVL